MYIFYFINYCFSIFFLTYFIFNNSFILINSIDFVKTPDDVIIYLHIYDIFISIKNIYVKSFFIFLIMHLNNLINNQNISELNSFLQNYDITYDKSIRIYSKRLNILKNKVGKCIIKIKMDLFKLNECSIVMIFGVLNKTLKRNVPLFYDFYKII